MNIHRFVPATAALALLALGTTACASVATPPATASDLTAAFRQPPDAARPWCYWWWFNGCVTRDGIVRDLDHMQAKGIGGAMVNHFGMGPHVGPMDPPTFQIKFMSPEWRELFKFTVAEAAKRGIVIGFNMCAGFNAGGPWVRPDEAPQFLAAKSVNVTGPGPVTVELPEPWPKAAGYHAEVAVLAWRRRAPRSDGKVVCEPASMVDLSARREGNRVTWEAPAGEWVVVRFACHTSPREYRAYTKFGDGPKSWEIDPLRPETMDHHFAETVGVLVRDVSEYVGRTFQFVQIDSSEIEWPDWTPRLRTEFQRRCGYDLYPYLAARANLIVDDGATTVRFQEDFDRTRGDLMAENYYGRLRELAHAHGLLASSQAAGYQKPRVDALRALGLNDISESEYWARATDRDEEHPGYIHQLAAPQLRNHDGIKTAASAAHTYGRPIVMAEALSGKTMGFPNYDKYPYAVKDVSDRAFCAGVNRNLLMLYVHQPYEDRKPGYGFGNWQTDVSRHNPWWTLGGAWLTYLSRCQGMLQQGQFAADVCYFGGEWVPSFVPARWAMNPALPAGYDCDSASADVLTQAVAASDGRLELASGMRYRYLVLSEAGQWTDLQGTLMFPRDVEYGLELNASIPEPLKSQRLALSPATLRAIHRLVEAGVTLVGPPPARAIGLTNQRAADAEVARLTRELWGAAPAAAGERRVGRGRVIWGRPLTAVFAADRLTADVEIAEHAASAGLGAETLSNIPNPTGSFDWIHRRIGDAEVYFVANLRRVNAGGDFTFRVAGRQPELWDPVTGEQRDLLQFRIRDGRSMIPLEFAPRQSFFIVFRRPAAGPVAKGGERNFPSLRPGFALTGAWDVQFDPQWFYPAAADGAQVRFEQLIDWARSPDPAVRHYSGTAIYRKTFDVPGAPGQARWLELGKVRNLARVRLNGHDLGVVWTAPWRVDISGRVQPTNNVLEIEVVNLWPNRLIGDAGLPADQRRTMTNIQGIVPTAPLFESGLIGPVTVLYASGD